MAARSLTARALTEAYLDRLAPGIDGIMEFAEQVDRTRGDLDYAIDGIVVKVSPVALWEELGVVGVPVAYGIFRGLVEAAAVPAHSREWSLELTLPPLGILILQRERGTD